MPVITTNLSEQLKLQLRNYRKELSEKIASYDSEGISQILEAIQQS